jgi:hypothetical protein
MGVAGFACAAAAVALVVARLPRVPERFVAGGAIGIALLALLAAPTAWAATTFRAPVNGVFPGAGPSFVSGLGTGLETETLPSSAGA